MKPVLTGLVILLLLPLLNAQSSGTMTIPDAVLDKFTLLYPDADNVDWKIQSEKYLAEFKNDKRTTSALLQADGTLSQTETEIKTVALPPEATLFLMHEVNVKKIEEATIIEDAPGIISFTAKADHEEFRFDSNGHLIVGASLVLASKSK